MEDETMPKKISLTTDVPLLKYGPKPMLDLAAKAGFDGIDYELCVYGHGVQPVQIMELSQKEFESHFKEIGDYAKQLGVEIDSTHSLVCGYGPDAAVNEQRFLRAQKDIEATALLGARYCVIHSSTNADWGLDANPADLMAANQKMYADLTPTAERFGVYLTLESFGSCGKGYDLFAHHQAMRNEFDAIKTKNKAFCLDSGHTHCAAGCGCLSVEDYIRFFGNRIQMLHLHDNNGCSDQHGIPGYGSINWPAVFQALDEIGYNGFYNFELELRPFGDCVDSAVLLLGKFLREFVEKKGVIRPSWK